MMLLISGIATITATRIKGLTFDGSATPFCEFKNMYGAKKLKTLRIALAKVHIANLNKSEAQQDEEKDGGDGGSVPRPEIRECFLVDLVHQRGRAGCLRATPGHY